MSESACRSICVQSGGKLIQVLQAPILFTSALPLHSRRRHAVGFTLIRDSFAFGFAIMDRSLPLLAILSLLLALVVPAASQGEHWVLQPAAAHPACLFYIRSCWLSPETPQAATFQCLDWQFHDQQQQKGTWGTGSCSYAQTTTLVSLALQPGRISSRMHCMTWT